MPVLLYSLLNKATSQPAGKILQAGASLNGTGTKTDEREGVTTIFDFISEVYDHREFGKYRSPGFLTSRYVPQIAKADSGL